MNPHRIFCISIQKDEIFSAAWNVGFPCCVLERLTFEDACFLISSFRWDKRGKKLLLWLLARKRLYIEQPGILYGLFKRTIHGASTFLTHATDRVDRVTCQLLSASCLLTFVLTLADCKKLVCLEVCFICKERQQSLDLANNSSIIF